MRKAYRLWDQGRRCGEQSFEVENVKLINLLTILCMSQLSRELAFSGGRK